MAEAEEDEAMLAELFAHLEELKQEAKRHELEALLSGELESTGGEISIKPGLRMSVLKQDQFAFDDYTLLDTVIMGNRRLYDIMKQKDALYALSLIHI